MTDKTPQPLAAAADARQTQEVLEFGTYDPSDVRLTQAVLEPVLLETALPLLWATQVCLEVVQASSGFVQAAYNFAYLGELART